MRLTPIVERLKTKGLKRVYGALELANLKTNPAQLPASFVFPEARDAKPNDRSGVHHQETLERFGVVTVLKAAALHEDRISEELAEAEEALIEALAGWVHPDFVSGCNYAAGRMLSTEGGAVSWLSSFTAKAHIRKVPS